jgi:D-psicose/D-tagatose/L-ribulose 3-epimerase
VIPGGLRLGAHTFIWAPQWDEAGAVCATASAAAAGLEVVEIPLLDPSAVPIQATLETLERYQMTPTCSLGLPATAHAPDHPDEAIQFLRGAIDTAAALGSDWLTGAIYGHLGHVTGVAPTTSEIDTIAFVLQHAADHAQERGIRLGIEVINRYETHLINTAAQAANLIDRIDRPGTVFGHLDTFHMNLEEPDVTEAVHLLGEHLGYVHLAESHRGAIGTGLFPFKRFFEALQDIDYSGPAVIEAFINAPPQLWTATASWRSVTGDASAFVNDSLTHIRNLLESE